MHATQQSNRYCAYLLRCWTEHSGQDQHLVWRFSIEDPHTGARQGFATFELLLAFLRRELDGPASADLTPPD